MTLGLEVLVQLVIAAITTSPLLSSNLSPFAMLTCWPSVVDLLASFKMDSIDALIPVNGTRSCGRYGPAKLGTTVLKSSSSTLVYLAVCAGSCHKPCNLQYSSTKAMVSSSRPVRRIYSKVRSSTGKKPQVAPYSGDILLRVARSASDKSAKPSPKYSTNLPTTCSLRSNSVTVKTKSVAVTPSCNLPTNFMPITSGISMDKGWPNIAASASIPPTPQPNTPRPLIIVVWLSVPTRVSGYAQVRPSSSVFCQTALPKYSRLLGDRYQYLAEQRGSYQRIFAPNVRTGNAHGYIRILFQRYDQRRLRCRICRP